MYLGFEHSFLHHLHLFLNAAVHLFTGIRKYDHVTLVLAGLHWLPVHIEFTVLLLTLKVLHSMAHSYSTIKSQLKILILYQYACKRFEMKGLRFYFLKLYFFVAKM